MSEALDVGTLSGRVELQDQATKILEQIGGAVQKFEDGWMHAGQTVLNQATAFFSAEAAIHAVEGAFHLAIDTLKEMTVEGARVAEVESAFDHLTASSGRLGSTLLNELRQGLHSTVDDFTLVKMANQDMAAGMQLSDAQFGTLAKGALALAKATGVDAAQAMETMNTAMLTGRTRGIALLTGKIDLKEAEEKYAATLGTTADRLTAEEKIEGTRLAILEAVGTATARLGDQQDGLDEKLDQLSTSWKNFQDELGKTIATSPVLLAGLDAVSEALNEAFGDKKADTIKMISHWVNEAAIDIVEFGRTGAAVAIDVGEGFLALMKLSIMVGEGIQAITYGVEGLLVGVAKLNDFMNHTDSSPMIDALSKDMDRLYTSMAAAEQKVTSLTNAQSDLAAMGGKLDAALKTISDRMKAADQETANATKQVVELSEGEKIQAQWAAEAAKAEEGQATATRMTAEEKKKLAEAQKEVNAAGETYHDTLAKMNQTLVEHIKALVEAGVSSNALQLVYNVTASQVSAVEKAIKDETKALELEKKATEDSKARWAELHDIKVNMSGTATEKMIADIEKWKAAEIKSHVDAKTDTADFYDWLEQESAAKLAAQDKQRLEDDVHSKAHFDKMAQDAADAYAFASAHADQFSRQYIEDLRESSVAADYAARTWMDSMGGSLDKIAEKAGVVKDAIESLEYTTQFSAEPITQVTIDSTQGGADALLDKLSFLMQNIGTEKAGIHDFASQAQYFSDVAELNALKAAYDLLTRNAKRKHTLPQFADGGIIDADMGGTEAMLHGTEAVLPLSREKLASYGLGGGDVTNHFYVNGTGKQVADEVSRILMLQLKSVRQFGAA